jgi:hypothetical protein
MSFLKDLSTIESSEAGPLSRILDQVSLILSFLLVTVALATISIIAFDFRLNFVHPTDFQDILGRTVSNGLSLHLSDLQNAITQFGISESRPRFLALLVEEYDIKLRLFLDKYLILPATLQPISWFLEIATGPFFLFRLVRNLGGDRIASTIAVAIYLSSTGFLSGISMAFIPGKALTSVVLIMAMYFLSLIAREDAQAKFSEAPAWIVLMVTVTVFLGLFLDEVDLFAFVLLPIMFWPLFWENAARPVGRKPDWKGIAICAAPGILFLAVVVVVVPSFYDQIFHRPFDYLGNFFAIGVSAQGAKSMFVGPHGTLGWPIIWQDFTNLFGIAVVPVQLSPFASDDPHDVNLIQITNLAQLAGLGAFFAALIFCATFRNKSALWLRRTLLAALMFVVLMTWLSIRHNPIIIGFYYGASISVFLALLVGLGVAVIPDRGPLMRLVAVAFASVLVLVQINNFFFVNERWRVLHYEYVVRPAVEKQINLSREEGTGAQLSAIWSAWKAGSLEPYLSQNAVPVDSVYLVYELRAITSLAPHAAP